MSEMLMALIGGSYLEGSGSFLHRNSCWIRW